MKKRALISVSDKTGVVGFARDLAELGFEIVSTGGTEKAIRDSGVPVVNISDITGFPECLDGRVKTLHPNVHAGVLAMRSNPAHMDQLKKLDIIPIDVVAINLYPFKETILNPDVTLEDAIENIDIGGPTMLRGAAKNWQDVSVVVDCNDYDSVIEQYRNNGSVSKETKFYLAAKVFEHTAAYDALISGYLREITGNELPDKLTLTYEKAQEMRYGENPHQSAAFYREVSNADNVLSAAEQLHGKELSYNNINDANGALDVIKEFGADKPCAVAVKHANPCGVGLGSDIYQAYMAAYEADTMSIFGGIVALNREVDEKTAAEMSKIFLEIIIAPSYSERALRILCEKKNIRLLKLPALAAGNSQKMLDCKKVTGGILVQRLDTELYDSDKVVCVTDRQPTAAETEQLEFAMKVVKHVKSNGIALINGNQTVGIGPGQTNRITALELALKYAGDRAKGAVMASDAFFPMDDCVKAAESAGITAIIQPGGSLRDQDSIDACNRAGIAMLFTGMRHFKH
ncbi:MAG: bifunctional phosphoribosylaminoimidazolecarboxamide formyltransferase/IMP cyclohydrolase [Oscillospiraceae bacterium]|nr:bifunctional phosphoribosylaminoimidazolecarboxamide formyltransferase/IMP cyclohydrolase [Oscillospiraceae bacterium]